MDTGQAEEDLLAALSAGCDQWWLHSPRVLPAFLSLRDADAPSFAGLA